MKTLFRFLFGAFTLVCAPSLAEGTVKLHLKFMGNPDPVENGIHVVQSVPLQTMSSYVFIRPGLDSSAPALPGFQWKCLTGAPGCVDGAEHGDIIHGPNEQALSNCIESHVYQGNDEGFIILPENTDFTIDAHFLSYTADKYVKFSGNTTLGQFGEYYMITAPFTFGSPGNTGLAAWLTRN